MFELTGISYAVVKFKLNFMLSMSDIADQFLWTNTVVSETNRREWSSDRQCWHLHAIMP